MRPTLDIAPRVVLAPAPKLNLSRGKGRDRSAVDDSKPVTEDVAWVWDPGGKRNVGCAIRLEDWRLEVGLSACALTQEDKPALVL
jgi:hypothetical protein